MLNIKLIEEAAEATARQYGLSPNDADQFVKLALDGHRELERELFHFVAEHRKAAAFARAGVA